MIHPVAVAVQETWEDVKEEAGKEDLSCKFQSRKWYSIIITFTPGRGDPLVTSISSSSCIKHTCNVIKVKQAYTSVIHLQIKAKKQTQKKKTNKQTKNEPEIRTDNLLFYDFADYKMAAQCGIDVLKYFTWKVLQEHIFPCSIT